MGEGDKPDTNPSTPESGRNIPYQYLEVKGWLEKHPRAVPTDYSDLRRIPENIDALCHSKDEEVKKFGLFALNDLLNQYGLNLIKGNLLYAWALNHGYTVAAEDRKDIFAGVRTNLENIMALEMRNPGAAKALYEQFGIRNFGRYPVSILTAQFLERDDKEKPYGVFLNAVFDYAPLVVDRQSGLSDLFQHFHEDYNVRIVEANSKLDLIKALRKLDRRYGDKQKISFGFVSGHGSKDSIWLGGSSDPRYSLRTSDLSKAEGRINCFVDNPIFVLRACSTGAEAGIGQEWSRALHATVIAPKVDSGLAGVRKSVRQDELFEVDYLAPNPDCSYSFPYLQIYVPAQIYRNGEFVREDVIRDIVTGSRQTS